MSFGNNAFGGAFGSNNNQQNSSGFGGFGTNNNTSGSGFGAPNPGTFGQNTSSGSSMFPNTSAPGAFGSGGGFGNAASAFGSKPTFGSTGTGGGLFSQSNNNPNTTTSAPSAFGNFGTSSASNTNAPFGSSNTGGSGLFGSNNAAKPAFGAPANPSLFNPGNTGTTSAFGSSGGFGAVNNPGLGGAVGDPPGTAGVVFQAYSEKEPNSQNQTNSYQNILFQDAYKKWSSEELRLADYLQGRRHGNASGAGAFGVNSGFGGTFGANNANNQTTSAFGTGAPNAGSGVFGSNANATTSSPFGQASNTAFGGGNNTTSSPFGAANKPAGGIFGNASGQQSGGVFGTNTGTGAFGSTSNTASPFGSVNNNTGGGIFGTNQGNKPQSTGFNFGNANANNQVTSSPFGAAPGTGFGTNNTTGSGGIFGANNQQQQSGGIFGNAQQPQQNTGSTLGGAFGGQNQGQQSSGLFGNVQKPATGGIFGTANTASPGGLFGAANNQQQNTNAFGANNASAGSVFGGAKPSTGSGLFGGAGQPNNNLGGTGAFGGLGQVQQPTGSGLFGMANNNQQQRPGSVFGNPSQSTGTGIFGGQNSQMQNSSLFGNSTNQQPVQNTDNSQQASIAPQSLVANLNDVSAYGSPSLFAGVGGNEAANLGPLAVPINGASKPRRGSCLPLLKLAAGSTAPRFSTPQKRGFGLSQSSYGTTAGSPAGSISSTPGALGRSLLGSSSSNALIKSMSTNNLRRNFNTEDSLLAPGAFSANSSGRWFGNPVSKKLIVNRDVRSDLFSSSQKEKNIGDGSGARKLAKRVSFDTSNVNSEDTVAITGALPAADESPNSVSTDSTPRHGRPSLESSSCQTPEMEQINGNELAIVHEEGGSMSTPDRHKTDNANGQPVPGKYWMSPDEDSLLKMNRIQRQSVDSFVIGRDNVGRIEFKVPVDLSGINIEDINGNLVQLEPRSATVYPVQAKKPPVGKGLNVPSRIVLEHSWPRGGRDKRATNEVGRIQKHIERLRRIPDTQFEDYDKDTGIWTFSVEHFTTYGLDDKDDSDDETDTAMLNVGNSSNLLHDTPLNSSTSTVKNELFEGAQGIPGAFDQQVQVPTDDIPDTQSFLGVSSADPASNNVELSLDDEVDSEMDDGYEMSEDEDMARSSVGQHLAAEQEDTSLETVQEFREPIPGGILRARMRAIKRDAMDPLQLEVADGDDWGQMLYKTVSPAKRDQHLSRDIQESPSKMRQTLLEIDDQDGNGDGASPWRKSFAKLEGLGGYLPDTQLGVNKASGFSTSIELMNSLFDKSKTQQNLRASQAPKGFPKWPYERQERRTAIGEGEQAFHNAPRPTWGPNETLVVTRSLNDTQQRQSSRDASGILAFERCGILTGAQEVRLAKFSSQSSKKLLRAQDQMTEIKCVNGVPMASLHPKSLANMFHNEYVHDPAHTHEKNVWELASILFDRQTSATETEQDDLARKNKLSTFWADLVEPACTTNIGLARSNEDKAVACLAGHRIAEASKHLLDGKNFCLATLVPLMGTSDSAKKDMREQIRAWHDSKMLSEFSEAIRTMYELLGGNVCVCEGMKGVPVEDRMESFIISKHFSLDWRQSFGLRLWYAISSRDSATTAVRLFEEDIAQDREDLPRPWYFEQGITPLWADGKASSRQDLLWGLLRLYADDKVDVEAILSPENCQLSPLDMRLCWQLGLALVSTGKVNFGPNGAEKMDAATLAYAAQLSGIGEWLEAAFVLLHLSDAAARTKAVQEHLCRHAGLIGSEGDTNFNTLTEKLQIPEAWLWEALALYMRSVKRDASAEVHCLLRASSFVEAHRVLVQQVAPRAVIERDYKTLSSLVEQFAGREASIADWGVGGEVYGNFIMLIMHRGLGETVPPTLLEKLMAGLDAMNGGIGEADVVRFAAVSDMADETAREVFKLAKKKQDMELRSKILNLPLTQDRLLAYCSDLGMDRYREVMSH
ncbi:hypothetical protein CDD82_1649 [Ophiocordyceps australis]|uniref:Peptidase S59 domain-containing protein n=1 Tax=Ophiocordyceps australis TaxID=1399860 RepID=A0A2C5ZHV4_9HYPO|nr:hypothetical protein CDD82_1649 [Ophiocordyceps australis]